MKKYIIQWDIGYGPNYNVVEACDQESADRYAYESAKDDFENYAEYGCIGEATDELLEEHGL